MSSPAIIAPWEKEVNRHFPQMSPAQARVLGQMSSAMMLTMHCGTTHISHWLAKYEGSSPNTVRQRVREWYYEASAKRGSKRREIQVEEHFAALLAWVVEGWEGEKRLAIVLDATTLGERFTCLSVGVVLQGCLIPVAWSLMPANAPGEWQPHWLRLLALLRGVIPDDWQVVVMTDRGLYAAWLFRAIQDNGWHPLMRVNDPMGFRGQGEEAFRPIGERIKRRGRKWSGQGEWSEQGERLSGTLLLRWEQGYEEKLALVTDLPVEQADAAWYQLRFWTEDGFKDQKRGGWRWEQTKMTDPQRASRLWLVLAVTMLWAVRVGSQEEGHEPAQQRLPAGQRKRGRPRKQFHRPRAREQSVVVLGQQSISVALSLGRELPLGQIIAQPWPRHLYAVGKPASSWVQKRKRREQRRRESHRVLTWKQRHQQHLEREREQEAKRLAKRELRRERELEQQAKRLARQERELEQQTRQRDRHRREQPVSSCGPCSAQAASPAGTSRPTPVLQLRAKRLVPFARTATDVRAPARLRPPRSPQQPPRPKHALVRMRHGCLTALVAPSVLENPP